MIASFLLGRSFSAPFDGNNPILDLTVARYLWVFGIGILARLYWDHARGLFEGKILVWGCVYAVISWISVHQLNAGGLFTPTPRLHELVQMPVLGALILSAAFSVTSVTKRLKIDQNDYSYGLYLYHMLVVSTLLGFGMTGHWWLWPVVYSLGWMLAAASWFLVEMPAQAFRGRRRTLGTAPQFVS
jgi:peptidoglycan/LPS O-acetylase OafA/YrhL